MDKKYFCRLCSSGPMRCFQRVDAKSGDKLLMAICGKCTLVQQAELPSDEELKIYYSHNYRSDYKKTYQPKKKHIYRAAVAALNRLRFLRRHTSSPPDASLLDIGAGGGELVYLAGKFGFRAKGLEPNIGYSEFANEEYGVEIQTKELDDLNEPSFDVVTLFHVFEHLAHPEQAMKRIATLIGGRGYLFVEVPNTSQNDASPHNIYFKAHLFYYSRYSLVAAASKYFDPVHIEDDGNLMIIFRKRDTSLDQLRLPSEGEVQQIETRLSEKGWIEYLIEGGGLLKPFRRIRNILVEKGHEKYGPRELLNLVFDRSDMSSGRQG